MKSTITKNLSKPEWKAGELVEHYSDGSLVIITGHSEDQDLFSGVLLVNGLRPNKVPICSDLWNKEFYHLFAGSITLEN